MLRADSRRGTNRRQSHQRGGKLEQVLAIQFDQYPHGGSVHYQTGPRGWEPLNESQLNWRSWVDLANELGEHNWSLWKLEDEESSRGGYRYYLIFKRQLPR